MTTNKVSAHSIQQAALVGDFVMDFYVKNDRFPTLDDYMLHLDYNRYLQWLEEISKIDQEVGSYELDSK